MKLSTLFLAFILVIPFASSSDYFNSPLNEYVIRNTTTIKCYNYFIEISNRTDLIYMKVKVVDNFTNKEFITEGPAILTLSQEFGGFVTYNLNNYSLRYSVERKLFDYFSAPHNSEFRNCSVL